MEIVREKREEPPFGVLLMQVLRAAVAAHNGPIWRYGATLGPVELRFCHRAIIVASKFRCP